MTTAQIHLSEIDIIILETTDITVTTMLLKRLTDENILVIFCDDKRLPSSNLQSYYGRHDSSLQLQKQINWTVEIKSQVWTYIVSEKILNQAQSLINNNFLKKAVRLLKLQDGIEPFDPTNREGHAARIYFNTLFGNKFSRKDDSVINTGLNYGYTLLMSMFAREIVKCGCLTQLGLKHANQFNNFNLASDFMEPFRPIIDDIVYSNRYTNWHMLKRRLFDMFTNTYLYDGKQMYLTNIVSDYTKKLIKTLNGEGERIPEFRV